MDDRWQKVRNLLVVRLDNLGDVLLMTPAIRTLRENLPNARVVLHASPGVAPVADLIPDLDGAIACQVPWMDPDRRLPQDPARELAMIERLRAEQFDAAIIFTSYHQSSLPAAYMCYLAGIPLRHAASIDGPGSLLTSRHRHPNKPMHEVERALDLVAGLGFPAEPCNLILEPTPGDCERARTRLADLGISRGRRLAVVHPGSTCPSRTYPWPLYARVAEQLQDAGVEVVLTGTPSERDLAEKIRKKMARPALSLAGETTLRELVATIAVADVVVTNNTGPMHVAAATGTPVAVLFAGTNPAHEWRPWRVPHRLLNVPTPCAPCYVRQCPFDNACISRVPPAEVVQAALELMATSPKEKPITTAGVAL